MSDDFDPYQEWLQITPGEKRTHYRLLGIKDFENEREVIRAAAKRQVEWLEAFRSDEHGDMVPKLREEVAAAKTCLLDPDQKAAYDRSLGQPSEVAAAPTSGRWKWLVGLTAITVGLSVLVYGIVSLARPSSTIANPQVPATDTRPAVSPPAPVSPRASVPPATTHQIEQSASKTNVAGGTLAPQPKAAAPAPPAATVSASPTATLIAPVATSSTAVRAEAPLYDENPSGQGAKRQALPSQDDQQQHLKRLRETLLAGQADTDEQKCKIARDILSRAGQTRDDTTERFVLLQQSAKLAYEGCDLDLMLQATDALAAEYDVDPLEIKSKLLLRFAAGRHTAPRIKSYIETSRKLIDEAVAAKRYDVVLQLADETSNLSQLPEGAPFRQQARSRRLELRKLARQGNVAKAN